MPIAREVYEEGLRLPPVFLVRGGRLQRDVLDLVLANVRTPDERRADLAAQLGAQATGERRLTDMAAREGRAGPERLARAASALMDYAERRVRASIRRLPRGRFRFADALDDDGLGSGPVRIAVTLTLAGDRVRADFTGSSGQTAGPVNAVEAVTRAATYYVVRCVLGGDFPVNDGAFRPIRVIAPAGTIVHALPPAAVAAGNVETSQRIVDAVFGAFARALPDRIPAASSGTMNRYTVDAKIASGQKQFDKAEKIITDNRVLFHRVANTLNYLDIKTVVVSCGTCFDQLQGYKFDEIFPGCRIIDIHELLMERGVKLEGVTGVRYMYHDPCHTPMKTYAPLEVARKLTGQAVPLNDRCCGESGTFAATRPDIATQVRFRKEEEMVKGAAKLRADGFAGEVKVLTACPSCLQGLQRFDPDSGTTADYIVVEMARHILGENWMPDFVEKARHGGIERVLL